MSPLKMHTLTLRSLVLWSIGILGFCVFAAYVLFQARFLIMGPRITLSNAESGVHTQRAIVLEGQAQNVVSITLNGKPMYTDTEGYFSQALILENGYTVATLQAHDRFGRSTQIHRSFVYRPDTVTN